MTGKPVPAGWQGGLPFTYRLTGGDALRVRLRVEQERRIVPTANVVATLRGARFPDQKVIVGSHHDAWTFGAADPGAGTIVVLEAARAFAEAAKRGAPPDRTLVFAHWGAEEFGLMGSTEWVEDKRADLLRGAVAYLNLDAASLGLELTASASPSLKELIGDVAGAVPQPNGAAGQTRAPGLAPPRGGPPPPRPPPAGRPGRGPPPRVPPAGRGTRARSPPPMPPRATTPGSCRCSGRPWSGASRSRSPPPRTRTSRCSAGSKTRWPRPSPRTSSWPPPW